MLEFNTPLVVAPRVCLFLALSCSFARPCDFVCRDAFVVGFDDEVVVSCDAHVFIEITMMMRFKKRKNSDGAAVLCARGLVT